METVEEIKNSMQKKKHSTSGIAFKVLTSSFVPMTFPAFAFHRSGSQFLLVDISARTPFTVILKKIK